MAPRDPSAPKVTRRKFIKRAVIGLTATSAIDAFCIEPRWLDFHRVEIPIQNLPTAFEGYRIALFSDTHIPRSSHRDFVRHACATAMKFRPDVICVPGDIVECADGVHLAPSLKGYFDALRAPDGVIATLGNHDHWCDAPTVAAEIQRNTPFELMHVRHRVIERGADRIAIGGVDDLWCGSTDVDATFEGLSNDIPRILLSHNPDLADDSKALARVDLMLSGHTHGGQVRIPFGPALRTPSKYGDRFAQGLVEGKRYRVLVTRGVCSVRHVRYFCRPEVTGIVLTRAQG